MSDNRPIWVFAGIDYEPRGGLEDCLGRYATLDEAIAGFRQLREEECCSADWWQIVDVSTGTVLRCSQRIRMFYNEPQFTTTCEPDADPMAIFELNHGGGI